MQHPRLCDRRCLTQGATTVLQYNLKPELQELFLPKMYSQEWGGTMCLARPGWRIRAMGAVTTGCWPPMIPISGRVKGQKCFITTGDWDRSCQHNPPGSGQSDRMLSLVLLALTAWSFLKFWVDKQGNMGAWNDVTTVGLSTSWGLHGSSTCTHSFGEID